MEVFRQAAPSVVSVKAIAAERSYLSMNLNAIDEALKYFIWNDEDTLSLACDRGCRRFK